MDEPERNDLIDATAALLLAAARDAGATITGDQRVTEEAAAQLLGWSPGSLKNARHEGAAPPHYRLAVNGRRVSYAIGDLAAFIVDRREA